MAQWAVCIALDGGLREGEHETQVVLIHALFAGGGDSAHMPTVELSAADFALLREFEHHHRYKQYKMERECNYR